MAAELWQRFDALVRVGLAIAKTARTGRVALARFAAAIDPAWIPRPWGDDIALELQAASEAAREPLKLAQVERILRDAWGASPTEELDQLEGDPVALTPGAQVHRGLLDG